MMMLIKSLLGSSDGVKKNPTFRLIPTTIDCPYNEVIFDPENHVLCLVMKEKKESFHMMPQLNAEGDVNQFRSGKTRPNGKNYPEERKLVDTYYENYITDADDIRTFVKTMTGNTSMSLVDQFLGN